MRWLSGSIVELKDDVIIVHWVSYILRCLFGLFVTAAIFAVWELAIWYWRPSASFASWTGRQILQIIGTWIIWVLASLSQVIQEARHKRSENK